MRTQRERLREALLAVLVCVFGALSLYLYATGDERIRRLREPEDMQHIRSMRRFLTTFSAAPAAHEREIADLFHRVFYDKHHDTWSANRWLGIPTQQNPNDVWVTQEIITETRPDVIVETGTAAGGSAVLWAMILEHVKPDGRVVTVDIKDEAAEARATPVGRRRIDFLIGSSTSPEIVQQIRSKVAGKRVLVILDSDHSKNHVLEELRLYAPMVTSGSYLIVQDTNINGNPVMPESGPGPAEALREFLPKNPQFAVDRGRERLLFTMHPGGYLRKQRN